MNRFYVGSPTILGSDRTKQTIKEAIDVAKHQVELTGEPQIVVQIVRIVRRQREPIVVEAVR